MLFHGLLFLHRWTDRQMDTHTHMNHLTVSDMLNKNTCYELEVVCVNKDKLNSITKWPCVLLVTIR